MIGIVQADEAEAQFGVGSFSMRVQKLNQPVNFAHRRWDLNFAECAASYLLVENGAAARQRQAQQAAFL